MDRLKRIPPYARMSFLAGLAMLVIGYVLLWLAPANPAPVSPEAAGLLNTMVAIAPKPGDRFIFAGLVLTLPLMLAAVFWQSRRRQLLLPLYTPPKPAAWEKWLLRAAIVLGSFVLLGLRVWTSHMAEYNATFTSHYESVTSAVVRIAGGGTCLADVVAQYGCHGEYTSLLLRLIGQGMLQVSTVYALLQCIAFAAAVFAARGFLRNTPLLTASILCLMILTVLNLIPNTNDPAPQYYPVRFFFPALSLLLIAWLQRDFSRHHIALAGAFGAAALTWNLESGLAVTIALGMFTALSDFTNLRISAGRLGAYILGFIGYLILFLTYLYVKSGGTIDLADYVLFQTTFYLTGFGMIPMPAFPAYWTIHAGIILLTLIYVAMAAARGRPDPVLERAAYVAILAVGLTLYYTGRSHVLVLRLVAWPDAILLFFLLERLTSRLDRHLRLALQCLAIALPALYLAMQAPAVLKLMSVPRTGTVQSDIEQDIAFIRSKTKPKERVAIFAPAQGILYGGSHTRPALRGVGVAEMIRRVDLARVQEDFVKNGPHTLFLGTHLTYAAETGKLGTDLPLDFTALRKAYALAGWSPGARLMYLVRKPYSGKDLFTVGDGTLAEAWGRPTAVGLELPYAKFDESFALHMRVTPAVQDSYGLLVSDHCCAYTGFAIQRTPNLPDSYQALVGDGKKYTSTPVFHIPLGRPSDVDIVYKAGHLVIRVNGAVALDQPGLGPIPPSIMPVTLGGWYGPGQHFAGEIHNVVFSNEAP